MGVKDLWEVLDEVKENRKLDSLSSKKIAIDLSGWVVQAETRKGLNLSKYPHVKLVYYRVRHLLLQGIHPVFVMEGKMPEIKEKEFLKRNHLESCSSRKGRSRFDNSLKQCQKLLKSLGVPCLKAKGEAEAYCAYLCVNKKVDAVMSEDSDTLLYGADPVYRGFKIENEDVYEYSLKSNKNKLQLDRRKCIALALLLGCDYGGRVSSIGPATALKFLSEAGDVDVLQKFQDWKLLDESQIFPGFDSKVEKMPHCSYCGHIGRKTNHDKEGCKICCSNACTLNSKVECSCCWHKNDAILTAHKYEMKIYNAVKAIKDFPNDKLINEFLNYTDIIPDDDSLEWKCPDIEDFKEKTSEFIGSTFEWLKDVLPLISAWQFHKLQTVIPRNSSEFLLQPIRIKKKKQIKKAKCFLVEWNLKDRGDFTIVETEEVESIFQKAYPNTVEEFYCTTIKEKSKPKKAVKLVKDSRKIPEYFSCKKKVAKHLLPSTREVIVLSDDENEPQPKKQCYALNVS